MNPFNNKKPFLVLGAGVLVLLAQGALVWFTYQKIVLASGVAADAEQRIALLERKEREFSVADANLKDFAKEIELLDNAFLSEKTFVDLLRLLEGLAKESGVKFSAESAKIPASPSQGRPATDKEQASLTFEISGNFRQVANFFALLDKIPYSGIIDSINISPKIEGNQKRTGVITARINYVIFNFNL